MKKILLILALMTLPALACEKITPTPPPTAPVVEIVTDVPSPTAMVTASPEPTWTPVIITLEILETVEVTRPFYIIVTATPTPTPTLAPTP